MKLQSSILKEEITALKPSSEVTVSEWASKYRMMTPFDSPAANTLFDNNRVPYLRGIMDKFGDKTVRMMVFLAGTQIGKSNVMMNMIGYCMSERPGPMMLALPTKESIERYSATRIDPMVDASPALKPLRLKKWKINEKHFSGGVLYLASAQSSSSLSSSSVEMVFADELKDWPSDIKAGDPVKYLLDRTKTFPYTKKIFLASSPSVEGDQIDKYHKSCEVQAEYFVPCPHCGEKFTLEFANLKFGDENFPFDLTDKDDPEFWNAARKHAYYQCEYCEEKITDYMKPSMLKKGEWMLKDMQPIPDKTESIGMRLNSLNSLDLKFGDIAFEFLESRGDRAKLKNFTCGWLAEPWMEDSLGVDVDSLQKNVCDLEPVTVPESAICLTCGIDVQKTHFYYSVYAWDAMGTGWLIHYGTVASYDEVRDIVFNNEYPIQGSEETMAIWRAAIDTGGNYREGDDGELFSQTEATYQFIRQYGRGKIFGVKGTGGANSGMRVKMSMMDKLPSGKALPGGLALYLLNVDEFKDSLFWRLEQDDGEPQRLYFHKDTGGDWFKHLSAERKVFEKNKWIWKKVRKRNDYMDTCVYNLALIDPQFGGGIKMLRGKVERRNVEDQFIDLNNQIKEQSYLSNVHHRARDGWIRRR